MTHEIRGSFFMTMKWITDQPGHYKLVDNDDPRPEVKLPSRAGSPTIKFIPSWRRHERDLSLGSNDGLTAADKFTYEREHEVKTDPKAARWEKSRREWFQKQKGSWVKNELKRLREKGL